MHDDDDTYGSIRVERDGAVATVAFVPLSSFKAGGAATPPPGSMPPKRRDAHFELAHALTRLREDDSIRVVVITGGADGEPWAMSGTPEDTPLYEAFGLLAHGVDVPDRLWKGLQGVRITFQNLVEMEKPVIAKVNGDAVGFAASVMFACDFIVARGDARIADHHMGMTMGLPVGVVPGDGGVTFPPMYLSPARAMEYAMLGKEYRAEELERLGAINYAVPAAELDAKAEELVQALLARPAYALAFTKRVLKRRMAAEMNLTMDAGNAYEWLNFVHYKGAGKNPDAL